MKPIKPFQPELQVRLHKTVGRGTTNGRDATSQRFRGSVADTIIDLTPLLQADGSQVQTQKGLGDPAGSFTITMPDMPLKRGGGLETVYGLIEPMDMVEIRMRHGAPAAPGKVPIVMRGFVTDVSRSESIDGGTPRRTVTISGQDYGKVWQILQINFFAGYLMGKVYLSSFALFEQYGVGYKTVLPPGEFFTDVVQKVLNPYLQKLLPDSSILPRELTVDTASLVKGGTVSPGIQAREGTIYELLRSFGDVGAWNEMFVEDREDGVAAVFRPAPFLDLTTGERIRADGPAPVYVDVEADAVASLQVSRSDANVANFFWVDAPRFNMMTDLFRRQAADASNDPTVVLDSYANADPNLYGVRVMRVGTELGGDGLTTHNSGTKAAEHSQTTDTMKAWVDLRRAELVKANKDNVLMERGSAALRGDERLRPGVYLRIKRGSFTSTYYVTAVSHSFVPGTGFFTNVTLDRGNGFVRRITESSSPYLNELKD